MAKRTTNKSQAIRDYLQTHPDATPAVIQQELLRQGVDVGYSLISQVKYKGAGSKTGTRSGPGRRGGINISMDDLVNAKQIADRLGGVERAKQALTMLERLR
jgi:hypothetical protein